MDLWGIIFFVFIIFAVLSCCGFCCSKKVKGTVLSTPVVVTSATHTAPGGYPVTQQMPPQTGVYAANVYSPTYPPPQSNATMTMPMPQPSYQAAAGAGGFHQMPMPQPIQQQQMNPPPYDVAVATGGYQVDKSHTVNEPYGKQAPYNPNYNP